jgi:hypothetical protein
MGVRGERSVVGSREAGRWGGPASERDTLA